MNDHGGGSSIGFCLIERARCRIRWSRQSRYPSVVNADRELVVNFRPPAPNSRVDLSRLDRGGSLTYFDFDANHTTAPKLRIGTGLCGFESAHQLPADHSIGSPQSWRIAATRE